ncbi:type II toxin-antitoxin system VapB family antitoxin [Rhodopila globiformis]|nr:type II toxin-antitoxin system VapB family antitoxin [Rhodopila globiformis]
MKDNGTPVTAGTTGGLLDVTAVCMRHVADTHENGMRTNIDIDDDLLAAATAATGLTTKKATVEEALRRVVQLHRQKIAGEELAGTGWVGDLDAMREGRDV